MADDRTTFVDTGGTLIHVDRTDILGCVADVGVERHEAAGLREPFDLSIDAGIGALSDRPHGIEAAAVASE